MNTNFPLEQMAKTGVLNVDMTLRQYKLDKMVKLMEIKSINPKLKQCEKTEDLAKSFSTLQRYRREKSMLSPYRILQSSKTHTRKQKASNYTEHDFKEISNDLKMTSKNAFENGKNLKSKK